VALGHQGDEASPSPPGSTADRNLAAGSLPTTARLHWIDWLRVGAIAGVFVYHTLRPFNTDDWHVKNAQTSDLLGALTTFFSSFGLAVLFLLAGAGVRFALRHRTWQTFLRERTARLLVPFVVGTLLLSPVQAFIEATHKNAYSGSYLEYLGVWAADVAAVIGRASSPAVSGIGYHLWFLAFLYAISVLALPLCRWLMGRRAGEWIRVVARRSTWTGASLTLLIPIYVLMGIGSAMGTAEHDWFEFAWYSGYFLIGFLLVSDDRFLAAVRRDLRPAVAMAAVVMVLIVAGIPAPLDTAGQHGMGPIDLAIGALFAALGWSWTLIVLNVGMRMARLQRPVGEHLGDAVLPVYVLHQPVILAVAFFVVEWPLGILLKWLVVFGVSASITIVLVEVALRIPLSRMLLGVRVRPARTVASASAGGSTSAGAPMSRQPPQAPVARPSHGPSH
jgi:peptidoglycan/LPS O-acetylase OafA/YrhL